MVVVWFGLKIGILFSLSFLQVLLSQWKALGFIIVAIAFLGYLLIANALWSSFTGSLKVRCPIHEENQNVRKSAYHVHKIEIIQHINIIMATRFTRYEPVPQTVILT